MMFKYQCLGLFGWLFAVQAFLDNDTIDLVVQKIPKFPFPIEKTFDITIAPKKEYGLLTSSVLDTLVIQISKPFGTDREIAIIDFGFKDMHDNEFNGKLMKVLAWNISEENKLFVTVAFSSLADNKILEIYHLNAFSNEERRDMLKNLELAKNIYRSNITLHHPTKIEIIVNSVINSTFQLSMSSTVDAICRAYNNSKMNPTFHKIKNMKVIRNSSIKHETKLQFVVTKAVHGKNLTCQVGNINKSIHILVFHAPTKVTFEPEVKKVVGNGTGITCLAADGFPIPRITWKFIEGPNNGSEFYTISPYNQTLFLSENAPIGSRWKFKCLSVNKILGIQHVHYSILTFTIVDKMHNNSNQNFTSKYESKHRKISENYDNYLIYELKRTMSNNGVKINNLHVNYAKLQREISKWKKNEILQKLELSKIKKTIELLRLEVRSQRTEIGKLKKIVGKQSPKPVPYKVTSKEPPTKPSSISKPIAIYNWKVDEISRLRRKRKTANSHKIMNPNFPIPMKLWLQFQSPSSLTITLYMYPFHRKSLILNSRGVAIITIYNAENSKLYKSIKKSFFKGYQSLSLLFHFDYNELSEAKVLLQDNIIIQCSLDINPIPGSYY